MTVPATLAAALADRFALLGELGRGGMAVVYAADDRRHQRRVAIKVLSAEESALRSVERFEREVRISARLSHPHIVPLYDSGRAGDQLYFVMPLVEGETLRARLAREGRLPVADAVRIAREVADALEYAHGRKASTNSGSIVSPPANSSDVSSQSTRPSFRAMKPSRLAAM
ncbi:serine/threonine-protein kinase [Gemmatimonas sp.]|uniref:serine/threonine-protein kinase n=1 Tax=Gemmatimonas sp. TaxID=1962908 RepID=UPI00333F78A3